MDDLESDVGTNYPPKPESTAQFPPNYQSDPEEEESNNSIDNPNTNDEENSNDDESSLESRGKRRKLDNFEFVQRKPLPLPISSCKSPIVKNSPPDWSEDYTFLLLEAWGDLFVKNGRKSLRSDEWSEVASRVNQDSRIIRSDSQCRNRLDTLKKKYKKEKARMMEDPSYKSDWIYFEKMDSLISSALAIPAPTKRNANAGAIVNMSVNSGSPLRLGCGVDAGEYVFANNKVYMNRANAMDEMRDSPGDTGSENDDDEDDDEDDDGLPPPTNINGTSNNKVGTGSSLKILADSIKKVGEVYERIENKKREQMMEIEKMRKEFLSELEMQKRHILERAQVEIASMRDEEGEDGDGDEDEDEDEDDRMVAENCDDDEDNESDEKMSS